LLKNATTSEKVDNCINAILAEFDTKKTGVLLKKDAERFVEKVLMKMKGNGCYNMIEFQDWFR
jgi:hypothetical protein